MAMEPTELRAAIEAILFISGEPVSPATLAEAFSDEEEAAVLEQLEALRQHYEDAQGGLIFEKTAGGYRFATRPDLDPALKKFFARQGENRLSMAALETLAIVAYKQPITAPEVSELRGVNSSGVIRTLLERKLVRIAGRKNVVGSPFLYRTTRDFLVHFGLDSLRDLPRLEEFAEVLGENMSEELMDGELVRLSEEVEQASSPDGEAVSETIPDDAAGPESAIGASSESSSEAAPVEGADDSSYDPAELSQSGERDEAGPIGATDDESSSREP